jgi:hypothetical protein
MRKSGKPDFRCHLAYEGTASLSGITGTSPVMTAERYSASAGMSGEEIYRDIDSPPKIAKIH